MNPLDYQRDGESVRDCIERYERCTGRDYGLELAASFDAADGVFAVELPSIETLRAMSWRHAIHPKDAAREASFGYDIERELAEVGPEPSDLLPNPADWIDIVRSDGIPPHDGRRCPECGYPLTEAHAYDATHPDWLLCPVCDSVNTGKTECAACGDEFESDDHDQYLCPLCQMSEVS